MFRATYLLSAQHETDIRDREASVAPKALTNVTDRPAVVPIRTRHDDSAAVAMECDEGGLFEAA